MLSFLIILDADFHKALLIRFRSLWTRTSTAIEGNTLTLDEVAFMLDSHLAVSGKSLKELHKVVAIPGLLI